VREQKPTSEKGDRPALDSVLTLEEIEKLHIQRAYNELGRNKYKTAKALGIGLNTLRRKLESYGME
jgi:two-component system response regulator AtoC